MIGRGIQIRRVASQMAAAAALAAVILAPGAAANTFPGANGLIAFDSDRDTPNRLDIYTVNGGVPVNLTNEPTRDSLSPEFTPDGRRIAFGDYDDGTTNWSIRIMDRDGSNKAELFGGLPTGINDLSFNSDGTKLAFTSEGNKIRLGVVGSGVTEVVVPAGINPSFVPGTDELVYRADDGTIRRLNLTTMDDDPIVGPDPNYFWPSVSPDGQRVAYSDGSNGTVRIVGIDGANDGVLRNAMDDPLLQVQEPTFSPDGTLLAVTSEALGSRRTATVPVGGGSLTFKTPDDAGMLNGDFNPDWQPIPAEDCTNMIDDDFDSLIDQADSADCPPPPVEICNNGIDDDGDGLIDQGDIADCPQIEPPVEICNNGIDDDGDTLIDAKDQDCVKPTLSTGKTKGTQPVAKKIKVKVGCETVDASDCEVTVEGKTVLKPPKEANGSAKTAAKKAKKLKVKLKRKTARIGHGKTKVLKVNLTKKGKKLATRYLKSGGRAIVKVKVTATDLLGSKSRSKLKVKLKHPKKGNKRTRSR